MESRIDINTNEIEKQSQNKFLNITITSLICTLILLEIILGIFTNGLQFLLYGSKVPSIEALWEQLLCYIPVILWLHFKFRRNDIRLRSFIGIIAPDAIVGYMNLSPALPGSNSKISGITTGFHLLNTIILAPIIEELIFRGVMLHRWSLKWGLREAIFVSSILFGLLHLMSAIDAFLFGLVMCTLYLRTQSILVPIVFHILNNFGASLPTLFELINGNTTETLYTIADLQSMTPYLPWLLLIALATGASLIIYLKRNWIELTEALPEI